MASGRELCYVLMLGMLLCYLMTFVIVARPTMLTCTVFRAGLGLSLALCYAALFTKTNRISRIFNRGLRAMVKRPSYTSPRSQLAICFCLVGVQAIGAATWIGVDPPHTTLVYPDRRTVVLKCKSTNVAILMSLMYNMVLIALCTIYAFKTRKIPENFNETKYIAFTMYSTCIVWLSFIPIYFGTDRGDFKVHTTALCMCVSISASVALACLFVPKVYIVLFQPHKNVRQGATKMKGLASAGRSFFGGCNSTMNTLDVACPTGLAMLIAQGNNKDQQQLSTEMSTVEMSTTKSSSNSKSAAAAAGGGTKKRRRKSYEATHETTAALLSSAPSPYPAAAAAFDSHGDGDEVKARHDSWDSLTDLNSVVQPSHDDGDDDGLVGEHRDDQAIVTVDPPDYDCLH